MGLDKSANIGMPDIITILEFEGRERKDHVPPTLPQMSFLGNQEVTRPDPNRVRGGRAVFLHDFSAL